jgi:hypothetical protein
LTGGDGWRYDIDKVLNNGVVAKILFQSPLPLSKIIPEVKPKINPPQKKVEIFNIFLIFSKQKHSSERSRQESAPAARLPRCHFRFGIGSPSISAVG